MSPLLLPRDILERVRRRELAPESALASLRGDDAGQPAGHAETLFFRPIWQPMCAPKAGSSRPTSVVVFGHGAADRALVRASLTGAGQAAPRVALVTPGRAFRALGADAYELDAREPADYAALLQALASTGQACTHVLYLWSSHAQLERVEAGLSDSLLAPLALAQALLAAGGQQRVRLCALLNSAPGASAFARALAGFVRTLHLEHARLSWRVVEDQRAPGPVDSVLSRALCERLLDELADPDDTVAHVRLERELRCVSAFEECVPTAASSAVLPPRGCYLVSGGLGGLGLLFARRLLDAGAAQVVLVGRAALDADRERLLSELRRPEGEVSYVSADVSDARAIEALVSGVRARHGRLDGVLHCAGVVRDALVAHKTRRSRACSSSMPPRVTNRCASSPAARRWPPC